MPYYVCVNNANCTVWLSMGCGWVISGPDGKLVASGFETAQEAHDWINPPEADPCAEGRGQPEDSGFAEMRCCWLREEGFDV